MFIERLLLLPFKMKFKQSIIIRVPGWLADPKVCGVLALFLMDCNEFWYAQSISSIEVPETFSMLLVKPAELCALGLKSVLQGWLITCSGSCSF